MHFPLRILHVLDKLHPASGVSAVVMNYFKNIHKDKIIFDFIVHETPDQAIYKDIIDAGGKIYRMPMLKAKNTINYVVSLYEFFKEHPEYIIVHGHIANAAVFYLGMARLFKRPVRIIHSHNTNVSDVIWKRIRNNILITPLAIVANRFMACSKSAAEFLFGASQKREAVILPNAINIDRYAFRPTCRQIIRETLNINADTLTIGHVGRLCPQKNHSFLIDVFSELCKLVPNSALILVGDGELREQIEAKVYFMGISEKVYFLGVRQDVPDILQAMDIFALPSVFEGLPVVGVEAQAAGLPCLFSNTITEEVSITAKCAFLPLSVLEWVNAILGADKDGDRSIDPHEFSAFSIEQQVQILEDYYLDCEE